MTDRDRRFLFLLTATVLSFVGTLTFDSPVPWAMSALCYLGFGFGAARIAFNLDQR